jgi:hypothetical protein
MAKWREAFSVNTQTKLDEPELRSQEQLREFSSHIQRKSRSGCVLRGSMMRLAGCARSRHLAWMKDRLPKAKKC